MKAYQNFNVKWDGAGWYILFKGTPSWLSQWRKADSLSQLDHAAKIGRGTAYLTESVLTELNDE